MAGTFDRATRGAIAAVGACLDAGPAGLRIREIGTVLDVGGGVARVSGLRGLRSEELVEMAGGVTGIGFELDVDEVGVVLLAHDERVGAGTKVRLTGRIVDTPVGDALLGRVIDARGRTLDERGPLRGLERWPVERPAPAIMDRAPVSVPLLTGIKVVDAVVPIGRGQRELILGDRQTGKTTIALDAVIGQRDTGVLSVYCAIGQRGTDVARVVQTLRAHGALEHTVVLVAGGDDPPGLQFITPFAAMSIAERFMADGRDVLVVFDDLTRHARAYRELSLLLRRAPGREAYPGDIFYLHSRLLERATHLRSEHGGGSITALPIVETQGQDISAYIPTNLISITDGQLYLSPELFRTGQLPAIDVGRSVSRVGGKAQYPSYRDVTGELRLAYSQFEELEAFSRFATRLDADTRRTIERGRRIRAVLCQPAHTTLGPADQLVVLKAALDGLLDDIDLQQVPSAEAGLREAVRASCGDLCERIDAGAAVDADGWQRLMEQAVRHVDLIRAAPDGGGSHGEP
jgi:F-type H+-transporting ATPase subunit alpha